MTSDRNLADRPYYPVGESYSDASETGELYPPIRITGVCGRTIEEGFIQFGG